MNRYPLNIFWSAEDKGFIAEAPDLPGCSAWGETEVEAAREAQDAIAAWLQAAKAAKRAIPKPARLRPCRVTAASSWYVCRAACTRDWLVRRNSRASA